NGVPGNLVANCGFETGNFANWIQLGDLSYTGVNDISRRSGNFGAFLGPISGLGFLAQTLPTGAGQSYNLTFWLRNVARPNRFQVYWNGAVIFDSTDMPDFPYTPYAFNNLVATGAATELRFGFFNVPDYFFLDDIAVVSAAAPGSIIGRVTNA